MNDVVKTQHLSRAEIEGRLDLLPSLPGVVVALSSLHPESTEFAEGVRNIAESDPPLAVRILAAANSAASAPITDVTSMEGALTRLGALRVSSLVTSLAVMRVFVPTSESQKELWRHSIQVAIGAREIAKTISGPVEAGRAYLMGLLHDIGRFVMFEHDPVELDAVDAEGWETPTDLLDVEEKLCGFNHAEIGAQACRVWGLPDEVSKVVEKHHELGELEAGEMGDLIRIIQLADRVSCILLRHADFVALQEPVRLKVLGASLVFDGKACKLISPTQLDEQLSTVIRESERQTAALGLGSPK